MSHHIWIYLFGKHFGSGAQKTDPLRPATAWPCPKPVSLEAPDQRQGSLDL